MLYGNNIKIRILKSRLLYILVCVLSGVTAIPLLAILGEVLIKGWKQLGWSFLTEATPNAYKAMMAASAGEAIPGGIANGIIGTFLMLLLAAVVAIPVGILCGICLSEYRKSWFAVFVSYLTDLLQGTPSIIIGIITYIWVVVPMKGYSAIAGSVALFIMMLPLIIRSTEETMKVLPETLKEAGLALGGSYWRVMLKVMVPSALGSIFTGILLAISRVVGETAPKEVVDATGCGDTYVLGYLYMRNKGASYAEAGCFAAAMSTIKLEKSGPFSGTEEEVWHILKSNKQKPEVLVAQ
jgi:phosphate transport system permease protein